MSEKRIWELLSRQFNKEITEAELNELQSLIQNSTDENLSPELVAKIRLLSLKPSPEDESLKIKSLEAIKRVIRSQGAGGREGLGEREGREGLTEREGRGWPAEREISQDREDMQTGESAAPWAAQLRRRGIVRRLTIALSAVACLGALIVGYIVLREENEKTKTVAQFETIVTRAGSKTLINLPDSSTVLLNSASKFAYNKSFGVDGREMELAGEAYFDIHKNAELPVVIHAGNVIIRVLGTTFNVRANPEDSFVEATLIRGSIEVSLLSDPERRILLRPNEKIVISKSENFTKDKVLDPLRKNNNEMISVTKIEPDADDSSYVETIWTKDRMVFHKESFASLAKKMERWYDVKIQLSDSALNKMEFTGSFERESLQEALGALQHLAPFSYSMDGKTVTVTQNIDHH